MNFLEKTINRAYKSVGVISLVFVLLLLAVCQRSQGAEKPVSILAARIGGHIHPSICQAHDGTLVVVYQGKNV